MQMQVIHCLSSVLTRVDHHRGSPSLQYLPFRDFSCEAHKGAQIHRITSLIQRGDVLFRYHEDVLGALGLMSRKAIALSV
jgi:hypothetical protein